MVKLRAAVALAVICLVGVFAVQNAAVVGIKFLFWKIEASLLLLIPLLLAAGAVIGAAATSIFIVRGR